MLFGSICSVCNGVSLLVSEMREGGRGEEVILSTTILLIWNSLTKECT